MVEAGLRQSLKAHIVSTPKYKTGRSGADEGSSAVLRCDRLVVLAQSSPEVFVYALSASEYDVSATYDENESPARLVYVEKVDSTGLFDRADGRNVARCLVLAYLDFCLSEASDHKLLISCFARPSPQYLFHESAENSSKNVLSDANLIRWWKTTFELWALGLPPERIRHHLLVPGEEQRGWSKATTLGRDWGWGLPFDKDTVATDCIPCYPDDVKTRTLERCGPDVTVRQFEELLAAAGECRTGLVGIFNLSVGDVAKGTTWVPVDVTNSSNTVMEVYKLLVSQSFHGLENALKSTQSIASKMETIDGKETFDIVIAAAGAAGNALKRERPDATENAKPITDISNLVKKKKKPTPAKESEPKTGR
ncbi:hypothetical protein HDU96_005851 [Phlyctochytrium bullatum]|nr:hypothetical protein HDU96_005851 [Phlyctochytrium bullatum]